MLIEKQRLSYEDFEQFANRDGNQDRLLELINGEIYEKLPTEAHGLFAGNIFFALKLYVKTREEGRVTIEVRYRPDDETKALALIPDVSYTGAERLQALTYSGSVPYMPDLAVEVKSPTDTYIHMRNKATLYLKNGSQMVWLVYPEKKMVEIYQSEQDVQILLGDDVIEKLAMLPEFSLPLQDVFSE